MHEFIQGDITDDLMGEGKFIEKTKRYKRSLINKYFAILFGYQAPSTYGTLRNLIYNLKHFSEVEPVADFQQRQVLQQGN